MSKLRAATTYKKEDGTLIVNDSKTSISWTPQGTKASPLEIAIADITNLQQTPAKSEKIALKIVVKASENHVFNFTSGEARAEQEAITATLKAAISALRADTGPGPRMVQDATENGGPSGSMAFAQAVVGGAKAVDSWYDDEKLKSNVEVQQSLLKSDPTLRQRFEQSLRDKPETITNFQFAQQFWSTRIHLLRAHAIERHQSQGAYNVLAEVKPKIVDGATKLNLTKEHVQLIFSQHPIMKRVYNEAVPKLSEHDFWARFFVSRLFKKLKGERITDSDSTDAVLDKYLDSNEESLAQKQLAEAQQQIPHFIDLEGNEQNHSQRKGNQPDFTMRPNEKVPILRVLNTMSERMLSHVAPQDIDDGGNFEELRLRDLQADDEEDRVTLNIKDQHRLFGSSADGDVTQEASRAHKRSPHKVLATLRKDLSQPSNLSSAAHPHTGTALAQLTSLIAAQRAALSAPTTSLSPDILASLRITHSTTTEFLHYFWTLMLHHHGGASRKELSSLLTTLVNSLARIKAVGDEAEKERQGKVNELKEAAKAYEARTGKRRKVDENAVMVGGRSEVEALMVPTVRAIDEARRRFEALNDKSEKLLAA